MKTFLLLALAVMPMVSMAAEKDPVAEGNLRKAIRSAGGQRLNTLKAPTMWMERGTYHGMDEGTPFVAQYATYWPRRWYRQLVEGKFAIGFAGEQVSVFRAGRNEGPQITGSSRESALHHNRVAWAQLLYPLLESEYSLATIPGVEVAGKATIGIKAVHESGSEVRLFFDQRTFLLTKTEAKVVANEMGGKLVKSETFFSDHKRFGGTKLPGKYRILYDGKLIVESERVAIKSHATIDPAWFGVEGPARVR
ncbi:MAG: hypothetical protein ACPGVU_08105 [Limisphaerales bacterium]